jgi:L-aspartate oxidase
VSLETEVLVVGSGIAGCAAALAAAREGTAVTVVTKASEPADAATDWAQGGVAVTQSEPRRFREDILAASDGTADPDAVDVLVGEAREAVTDVLVDTLGVPFDRAGDAEGRGPGEAGTDGFELAREAGHSERRILHVDAATGRAVLRPFLRHLQGHERVTVLDDTAALDLLTHEGHVHGAVLDRTPDGGVAPSGHPVFAGATVLATGGIGACYERSTNPDGATGDGVAMAALAGANVADMEYVQFHPTVYDPEVGPDGEPFLLSEAVRGEGAVLVDADGERFMSGRHEDADLAPRDVVARAVDDVRATTGAVRLDVSGVDFAERFPGLAEKCADRGVDPVDGIPVAPAQHFLCGGVAVDDRGRASLGGLYAVGECARTGVHGANRLASTSLLEGLVWGLRAGTDAAGREPARVEPPDLLDRDPDLPANFARGKRTRLRQVMAERVGLRRTPEGLREAAAVLRRLKGEVDAYVRTRTDRSLYELRNAAVASLLVARAAADNPDSVGTHHLEPEVVEA